MSCLIYLNLCSCSSLYIICYQKNSPIISQQLIKFTPITLGAHPIMWFLMHALHPERATSRSWDLACGIHCLMNLKKRNLCPHLTLRLPSFFCDTDYQGGGGYHPPWILGLV